MLESEKKKQSTIDMLLDEMRDKASEDAKPAVVDYGSLHV